MSPMTLVLIVGQGLIVRANMVFMVGVRHVVSHSFKGRTNSKTQGAEGHVGDANTAREHSEGHTKRGKQRGEQSVPTAWKVMTDGESGG